MGGWGFVRSLKWNSKTACKNSPLSIKCYVYITPYICSDNYFLQLLVYLLGCMDHFSGKKSLNRDARRGSISLVESHAENLEI
jgi:hypothetical protein